MTHLFIIVFLGFCSFANANSNDLSISKPGKVFKNFTLLLYEDPSASLSFAQIKKIKAFIPHANHISNGYSNSHFWLKFKIKNATQENLNYFIQFTENMVHELDCYIESSNGETIKFEQGIGYYSPDSVNELVKPLFNIHLNSGESKMVYFRMFSIYPNMTSLIILNEQSLHRYTEKYNIIYALYFGSILALLLYNLVIYFFSREKSYLYYVIYGALFLSWQLMFNGYFPFNTFNSAFSFYLFGFLAPLWIAFLIFFSNDILNTKTLFPVIHKGLKYVGYLYLVLAVTVIFYLQQSYMVINSLVAFVFPYLLYVGFKSYFSGNKTALFFIVAQLSFISMSTLFALSAYGYLEYSTYTRHGIVVGSLVEIILFSLALAYRIRTLQQEKLAIVNMSNLELDKKVNERTRELEKSQELLKELVHRDPMTHLYNRRFLYTVSQELIKTAKREKSPLSLIIFDIDHFKNINDFYGHKVGDAVIKLFADLLQRTRDSDVAVRFGGEEFVLLLPNTDKYGAYKIATQIREDTATLLNINTDAPHTIHFTVSGGVDSVCLETEDGIDSVIHRADTALYKAKHNGRNQIILLTTTEKTKV